METNAFLGISLTGAFIAGLLALFAPCCITFLLPSYLGTIFKQKGKIILYTLLFSLGLASILTPVALGFRFFIYLFDQFHREIYYLGGAVLIFMGITTLKPLFHLPQLFHFNPILDKRMGAGSAFGLGVMSGLTSSCCAPVLFAAVTLTSLSPSLLQSIAVSLSYVLGIVFPLFVLSLFYEKGARMLAGKNRQRVYRIFQLLGAALFILSGLLIIIFNFQDKIEMYQMEKYSIAFRLFFFNITRRLVNPVIDIPLFIGILFVFYKLITRNEHKKK